MVKKIPKKRKVSKRKVSVFNKILTQSLIAKTFSLFLIFSLSFLSLAPTTNAYYNDIEKSVGNIWTAGILDFVIKKKLFEASIGPEVLAEKTHVSVMAPTNGSLPIKYTLNSFIKKEDAGLCGKLFVEAKLNGLTKYSGPFSSLINSTTTTFGTWEFLFDMPPETVASHGDICQAEAILFGWRADSETPEESVFTDTEKISFSFKAKMVVLNEIYPRPDGSLPELSQEYIELYNNGSTPVDLAGWKISDMASTSEKFYTITSTPGPNTAISVGGSTVLPPLGFLVFNLSDGTTLNNSGDTVRLYDNNNVLQDAYTYPAVPEGKSIVRFPDGIGFWIDPEPTPGISNVISLEDLENSGLDKETIRQIIALAEMKNATIVSQDEESNMQDITNELIEDLELSEIPEESATSTEEVIEEVVHAENITEEVSLSNENIKDTTEEVTEEDSEILDEVSTSTEPSLVEGENEIPQKITEENEPNLVILEAEEVVAEVPPYKEEEMFEIENTENNIESTETNSVIEEIVIKEEEVVFIPEAPETLFAEIPVVETPKEEILPEIVW